MINMVNMVIGEDDEGEDGEGEDEDSEGNEEYGEGEGLGHSPVRLLLNAWLVP